MKHPFFNHCFLIFFLMVFQMSFAQVDLKQIVPPNPNVASLMKATLTPVTEYAGLPNVSIPIYTINEGNIQLPISLSYHTGGIQVNEESGNVGLGWALNAGGVLTRTINGNGDFDEDPLGKDPYLPGAQHPDPVLTTDGTDSYFDPKLNQFIRSTADCNFLVDGIPTHFVPPTQDPYAHPDFMPDFFTYNFNGHSGSFVLKRDGTVFLTKKNGVKVFWNFEQGSGFHNLSFTFIMGDGAIYEFKTWGKTNTDITIDSRIYISTWYLSKIISTNGNVIDFLYEEKGKSYPLRTFIQNFWTPGDLENSNGSQVAVDDIYLTEIRFKNGNIKFNYSNYEERQDISKSYYLKNIEVSSHAKIIKKYDFNYSYFGSSYASPLFTYEGGFGNHILRDSTMNPSLNLRLKLDSVVENDLGTYSFEYFDYQNAALIPNKTTMSQDYWGFYNGIRNETSFIPYGNEDSFELPIKAKRFPIESQAKLFSLNKITYPTKGYTVFNYELNTYDPNFDHIPISIPSPTIPTVEKSEYVNTNGGGSWVKKEIYPKDSDFKVRFNLAIYGSNVSPNADDPLPNRYEHPFKFETDMIVRLRRNSDNSILWSRNIPSEQAYLDFEQTGQAFYSEIIDFGTPENGGYTLEAYFNDYNGLFFGMVEAIATWPEFEQSETEAYSIGGGLRVKSIADYDNTSKLLRKRKFNYHYNVINNGVETEKSYGKIKMMPDFGLYHKYAQRKSDGSYRQLIGNATSHNSYTKHMGSYIGYSQVEVTYEDNLGKNNGKTVSKFFNHEDFFGTNNLALEYYGTYFKFTPLSLPHNGTLYKQEKYKRLKNGTTYILVHELYNEYKMNSVLLNFDINKSFKLLFKNSDYVMSGLLEKEWSGYTQEEKCLATLFNFYPYYSPLIQQSSQKETLYDLNGENPVITTQNFYYDNNVEHFQKTRIEIADSRGNTLETKIYYPDDISGTSSMEEGGNLSAVNYTEIQKLKKANKHQINTPIQKVFKKNGIVTKVQRNLFDLFDELVLPSIIQTAKDNTTLEDKIIYHDYYLNGNPKEVSKVDGTPIVYIWGYSEQYPIAKIENASFTTITSAQQTLIDNAIVASENDTNTNTENTLRTALQSLRDNFSTSMVTTYTYDPLIGVTSITDPKGYTIYYEYDAFNRLKQVKDADGKLLSENEYHYKNQQ